MRHYHLICKQCGKVDELELDFMARYKDLLKAEKDFEALEAQIKIYGLCHECVEKNRQEQED